VIDLNSVYSEIKWWLPIISILTALYKGFQWLKSSREEDLKKLHLGLDEMKSSVQSLESGLEKQTATIVGELKEQRADFRTFFSSVFYTPVIARAIKETVPPPPSPKKRKRTLT
jgi:hypothetical protein